MTYGHVPILKLHKKCKYIKEGRLKSMYVYICDDEDDGNVKNIGILFELEVCIFSCKFKILRKSEFRILRRKHQSFEKKIHLKYIHFC